MSDTAKVGGFEYWAVGIGRDTAAITLFLVFPVGQILSTRVAPPVVLFCLLCLLMPLVITGNGSQFLSHLRSVFSKTGSHRSTRCFYAFASLFLGWMTLSLFWSPLKLKAADDVFVLTVGLLVAPFLGLQCGRIITFRFDAMFKAGLTIGSIVMLLDLYEITAIHALFSDRAVLWDLNRTAIYLTISAWSLLLFKPPDMTARLTTFAVIALVGLVVFNSESQSAQLAYTMAILALPVVYGARFARPLLPGLMAAVVLVSPLLIYPLEKILVSYDTPALKQNSVLHRVELWKGYFDLIAEKPVLGWGAKADRHLGKTGRAAVHAKAMGFPETTSSPHNLALEIWVNFGLLGAALFAALLSSVGWMISRMPDRKAAAVTIMCVCGFTASMFHSSALQSWLLGTLAIAFAVPFAADVAQEDIGSA